MKAIVASEKDTAGMNIYDHLLEEGFESTEKKWQGKTIFQREEWMLIQTESNIIHAEEIGELATEEIIFISRHSSEKGKPSLTTHYPGNFGANDYGGREGELCWAQAERMKNIYLEMLNPPFQHDVSLEVTHHGPLISQPCLFVELGSTEEHWENQEAAKYLAKSIIKGIGKDTGKYETAIGIGGNHYAAKFSEVEKDQKTALGHMLPKYAQKYLDKEMVNQMIKRTLPKPNKVVLDKKGVRKQSKVREMLEETGLEVILA